MNTAFLHPNISPAAFVRLGSVMNTWQRDHGAVFINLPWTASGDFVLATKPLTKNSLAKNTLTETSSEKTWGRDTETPHGFLLASGEQAFLAMADVGELDQFQNSLLLLGITPCFRDENVFDETHHFCFLKAELFQWLDLSDNPTGDGDESLRRKALAETLFLANKAATLLGSVIKQSAPSAPWCHLQEMAPDDMQPYDVCQWDVYCGDTEIGSYGVRQHPTLNRFYLYGTAIAEPRMSFVINFFAGGAKQSSQTAKNL